MKRISKKAIKKVLLPMLFVFIGLLPFGGILAQSYVLSDCSAGSKVALDYGGIQSNQGNCGILVGVGTNSSCSASSGQQVRHKRRRLLINFGVWDEQSGNGETQGVYALGKNAWQVSMSVKLKFNFNSSFCFSTCNKLCIAALVSGKTAMMRRTFSSARVLRAVLLDSRFSSPYSLMLILRDSLASSSRMS